MRHGKLFGGWALAAWLWVGLTNGAFADGSSITLNGSPQLPFELIDNRIFLQVMVNGKGPFQFVFDTGGRNILDLRVAKELGLALTGDEPVDGAGAATQQAWSTHVDSASIGDIQMRAQDFMVLSLDAIRQAIGFRRLDGIVGRELFERFVVDIDYGESRLTFLEPARWTPPKEISPAIALGYIGDIPAVTATVDGLRERFVIDTGDRSSLTLFGPFVKRHSLRAKYPRKVRAVTGWGVGGPIPADVTRAMQVEIGGFTVRDVVTRLPLLDRGAFASTDVAGSVGTGLLKRFRVVFDYSRRRMFLSPNASFGAHDPHDRSGLWLSMADGGFRVMSVVDGSPAAVGGVRVDDIVTAVNGVAAVDIFLVELRERLKTAKPGSIVRLKLKTIEGEREVELTLRDLI